MGRRHVRDLMLPGLVLAALPLGLREDSTDPAENPVELGSVRWGRDLDAALARARDERKLVFALFQEIPGCATCQGFGAQPLSHPLLVEAIEELFVPLAIHNNRPGKDAQVLERYGEPAWNNPVVRFLKADGEDALPRRDRLWSTGDVAGRMLAALEAAGREVPRWLALVAAEEGRVETATFSMHCFWEGEARLGALDGVVGTRVGWQDGREVVEVRFDPRTVDRERLSATAEGLGCTPRAAGQASEAKPTDRRRHLRRSLLRLLPLTPMQATKLNAALAAGADGRAWLSPRQLALSSRIERVAAEAPGRLEGLAPPRDVAGLADYERELRGRLDE